MRYEDAEKLVDDYIKGKLSPKEREAFEQHYFECSKCFENLEFREAVAKVIEEHGEELFAEYMKEEETVPKKRLADIFRKLFPRPISWRVRWAYIGASIAIVLILVPILYRVLTPNRYAELTQFNAYPYISPGLREGATQGEIRFNEGMEFYNAQEYGKAAQRLEEVIKANPEHTKAYFYLGICYLFKNKASKAISNFTKALEYEPLSPIYHWYLGHAYLKSGDGERALKEFETVVKLGGDWAAAAQGIIEEIEQIRR